jgi:hypothetical protein
MALPVLVAVHGEPDGGVDDRHGCSASPMSSVAAH